MNALFSKTNCANVFIIKLLKFKLNHHLIYLKLNYSPQEFKYKTPYKNCLYDTKSEPHNLHSSYHQNCGETKLGEFVIVSQCYIRSV
jgi:hypothetical protein